MENMKNKMTKRSKDSSVAVKKGYKPEEIRKAQNQYAKKHNSQYSILMADVKKRLAETKRSRTGSRNKTDGDVDLNDADAVKSSFSEDPCPISSCNVESTGLTGSLDEKSPVTSEVSCVEDNSKDMTDLTGHSSIKSASKSLENVRRNPSSEKELHKSTSPRKQQCSNLIIGHDKGKTMIDTENSLHSSTNVQSSSKINQSSLKVTASKKPPEDAITKDNTATICLTDDFPDKKSSSSGKERLNKKMSPTKESGLILNGGSPRNYMMNKQLNNKITNSVNLLAMSAVPSSESPIRSSPRKQLFSPNTAGIACNIITPTVAHLGSPRQTYVEDSDPEESNEISFMDAIAESIDMFGSESILDSSSVCKDLWPALSQTSKFKSHDPLSQSDLEPDGLMVRNGQKQNDAMSICSSDSDILDCVNEEIQVTSDLGISTRRQKAESRTSSLRRSARCNKRIHEHATENATPKRKRRK
ncbi:uncharacterized protein LOC121367778 isoform X2 [Gigantopelta aegis]|nr:uncharacterized protein LOC121367778 isoform X2 [Gigantopelta aegis]XP_041348079.1 uncharacterized protein LOC121367778 isoform X2 [Gigantopelta aegis]